MTFEKSGKVTIEPIVIGSEAITTLETNLMLFFTEMKRDASQILQSQNTSTTKNYEKLIQMRDLVDPCKNILSKGSHLDQVGDILHKNWQLKRSLTTDISSKTIDSYYRRALKAGAIGGKILGAGGGGFLLFYVPANKQKQVANALKELFYLKVKLENVGSIIKYVDTGV